MDEVAAWASYMQRRGSLNLGLRIEAGFALVAVQINRALGGKAKLKDFMPHVGRDEEAEGSIQDVMSVLMGAVNPGLKKGKHGT